MSEPMSAVKSNMTHWAPEFFGTPEEHGNIDIRPDQINGIAGQVLALERPAHLSADGILLLGLRP